MPPLAIAPAPPAAADPDLLARALQAWPEPVAIVDAGGPDRRLAWVNDAFARLAGRPCDELAGWPVREHAQSGPAAAAGDPDRPWAPRQSEERAQVPGLPGGDLPIVLAPIGPGRPRHAIGWPAPGNDARIGPAPAAPSGGAATEMLDDRVEQALARAHALGTRCALLLIDVDRDGAHPAAHELALAVGEAATDASASLSLLPDGRLALLVDPAPPAAELAVFARRVLHAACSLARRHDPERRCAGGIAVGPLDGTSAQSLRLAAQRALAAAHARRTDDRLAFFDPAQDSHWLARRQLEADLERALAERALTLAYQPLLDLDSGAIVGFEALLRWTHPLRGAVSPAEFVPVAESSGLIVALGDWVLGEALAQLAAFDRVCTRPLRMAVNVAAAQLARAGFADAVKAHLAQHAIAPGRLELEITERTLTGDDAVTRDALQALRRLGVRLAMDDFGTGYSNLHGLTQLPVDTLKIDRSLTQAVTTNPAAASVSRMVCELARVLDLKVVVEGIETESQLGHFRRLGPLLGQGWLFSRALDPAQATALLASRRCLLAAESGDDRPHLLLLDDEANVLAALRRALRREGWPIHATTSPQEALEILAAHPVGVVVCDQRMPQVAGTEFLRQVRQQHPLTVRVLLSGYSEIGAVTAAINDGAVWRYLYKPWDDEAIREHVRQAFDEHRVQRESQREREEALQRGDRLARQVSQRDAMLALEAQALSAAQEVLLRLPVPVLGLDPSQMVVLSNPAADRLLGAGAPLLGRMLDEMPPALAALVADGAAGALVLPDGAWDGHVEPLAAGAGWLVSLVPADQARVAVQPASPGDA